MIARARAPRSSRRAAADPDDRHGAALRLARLGGADPATQALHGYVRTLFDQYAPRFDRALADLSYSAPALLREAVDEAWARASAPCSISAAAPGSRARRSARMWTGWSASISRRR